MAETLTLDARFNGPPDSANGGYVCGQVANLIGGRAEVTLRRPPPLGRPLDIERGDGGAVSLRDGETVVAEGVPASVEIDVPAPVPIAEAETAAGSYEGFKRHYFPTCFVCGPQRGEGDGLRIFAGAVPGRDLVAAPWTPDASLAGEDGLVRSEFVWAALDCPGAWALLRAEGAKPVVLGRLAARLVAPVRAGEPHVAIAWPVGKEGRRIYAGSALFTAAGGLLAFARATWVELASPP